MDRRRILALWATPRTVSTAFERMVIERDDHVVLDEPFSRAYYFGPDRRSDRYPLSMPESGYEAVLDGVLATARGEEPVFVKDMAYQAEPGLPDEALDAFRHTFLIRDPDRALASLARGWPDFSDDEAGYDAQRRLFDRVREHTDEDPVVVDSDDLRRDPEGVIGQWCDAVGLDVRPDALEWEAGHRPEWPLWQDWYTAVSRSTGFLPPDAGPAPTPVQPGPAHERARRHYETLASHRVG